VKSRSLPPRLSNQRRAHRLSIQQPPHHHALDLHRRGIYATFFQGPQFPFYSSPLGMTILRIAVQSAGAAVVSRSRCRTRRIVLFQRPRMLLVDLPSYFNGPAKLAVCSVLSNVSQNLRSPHQSTRLTCSASQTLHQTLLHHTPRALDHHRLSYSSTRVQTLSHRPPGSPTP
jgi:hypothetical protein